MAFPVVPVDALGRRERRTSDQPRRGRVPREAKARPLSSFSFQMGLRPGSLPGMYLGSRCLGFRIGDPASTEAFRRE